MKWENLRASIAAKAAALILLVIMVVLSIVSVSVIVYNAEQGWYGISSKQAKRSIDRMIAEDISVDIANGVYDNMKLPKDEFGFTIRADKKFPTGGEIRQKCVK